MEITPSVLPKGTANPLSHRYAMPAPPKGELYSCWPEDAKSSLFGGAVAGAPERACKANACCPSSGAARHLPPVGEGFSGGGKVLAKVQSFRVRPLPLGGAVAQRLRGFKSAEPEKTVKRSSRRTGVNLQFFPVQPSALGLKGASSPFFVAPARRNRWHFSGSLLVSKENISRLHPLRPPLFHMEHFTSPRRRWGYARCTRCSRPSLPGGRWRARRCRSSAGWRGRWC